MATASNPAAGTLGGTLTAVASNGVATFSNLNLNLVGNGYTLQVSGPGLQSATTTAISITPGAASQFLITSQPPATVTAGTGFGLIVTAEDAEGNVATGYTGSVSLSLTSNFSGVTLGGATIVSAAAGVANFSNVTLNLAGSGYTLQVSSGSLVSAASNSISVTPSATTQWAILNTPTSVTAGVGFALTVAAEDGEGNVATSFAGSASLTRASGPLGGTLGGTTTATVSSGLAVFSNLTLNVAGGGYALGVAGGTLASATSTAISVVPGAVAQLLITAQPPATVSAGTGFGVSVVAEDVEGNIATNYTGAVSLTLSSGPIGGTLSGTTSTNAVSGVAVFSRRNLESCRQRLHVAGLERQRYFGHQQRRRRYPGSRDATGHHQPAAVGNSCCHRFRLHHRSRRCSRKSGHQLRRRRERCVGQQSGRKHAGGRDSVTASSGVAVFTGLTLNLAGSGYTLAVGNGTLASATSSAISVTPGTATQLVISNGPFLVSAGIAFGLTVAAQDAEGNTATSFSGNVSLFLSTIQAEACWGARQHWHYRAVRRSSPD